MHALELMRERTMRLSQPSTAGSLEREQQQLPEHGLHATASATPAAIAVTPLNYPARIGTPAKQHNNSTVSMRKPRRQALATSPARPRQWV